MISVGTLLFITTDDMVVSMGVIDGEISSLLGNIVEGEAITVRTLLFNDMITLGVSVPISVIVGEISSVRLKLGVGVILGEDEIISLGTLVFITMMVKLSVSISVTEGDITSLVGPLVRIGNKDEDITVGMLLSIITVKLSVSISVMVGEISSIELVMIKLGVKIRLGSIVEGEVIKVATSLVFIMSLVIVIGISMVVVTSGCIVVKTSSLLLTGGSVRTLEIFVTVLGVIILVTSDDGEGTTLVIFIITLVTGSDVKLNVSINENVVIGEITSLVITLVAVSTDVGVTGRVPVVSSILITSLLVTLNIVMTLEISNDGTVVKAMVSVIDTLVSVTIDGVSIVTNTDEKVVTKDVLVGI